MYRILYLIFIMLCATSVVADEPLISVTGEGSASAVPDMAVISLGVSAQSKTARDAVDQVSATMGPVLTGLENAGIDLRDIQTSEVSLNQMYDNRSTSLNGPDVIGYSATSRATVRVRDLNTLGSVLDTVLDDGANRFGGLRFGFQDEAPLMKQARQNAVADAIMRATTYAEAAGLSLGPIISIREEGGSRGGPVMMEMAAVRVSDVPVAAGESSMSVRLRVEFGIEAD